MAWTLSGSKQKYIDISVGRAMDDLQAYFNGGPAWRVMHAAKALMEAAVAAEGKEVALMQERHAADLKAMEAERNAKYSQDFLGGLEAN